MDRGFSALVEDLAQRGFLDDTTVINSGEFGRTPRMNQQGGRDHWPNVYSVVLASGGAELMPERCEDIGRGDGLAPDLGPEVVARAEDVAPHDRLNRPYPISDGRVMEELL